MKSSHLFLFFTVCMLSFMMIASFINLSKDAASRTQRRSAVVRDSVSHLPDCHLVEDDPTEEHYVCPDRDYIFRL